MSSASDDSLVVAEKTVKQSLSASNLPMGKAASVLGGDAPKLRVPLNALQGQLRHLLLWEDVVHSAFALGGGVVALYVMFFNSTTPITTLAHLVLAGILANLAYVNCYKAFALFSNRRPDNPNERHFKRPLFAIDKEQTLAQVSALIDQIEALQPAFRDIVYCADTTTSVKAAVAVYAIAWFGDLLPLGWTLLLVLVTMFVVPVQYVLHQEFIDAKLEVVQTQAEDVSNKVLAQVKEVLRNTPLKKYVEN